MPDRCLIEKMQRSKSAILPYIRNNLSSLLRSLLGSDDITPHQLSLVEQDKPSQQANDLLDILLCRSSSAVMALYEKVFEITHNPSIPRWLSEKVSR